MKNPNDLLQTSPECVLFTCVAGSRAYGTHTHESDEDTRGIYAVRADRYLDLDTPLPQLADERGNTVYFSLRRFIELLAVANPNVLELLFMPLDCVRSSTEEMDRLIHSRNLFITRQCGDTHIGYAMAQIKKARGQNKWVNQPKTSNPPTKEEFCYVIPAERLRQTDGNPCRPMPLPLTNWNLAEYHAARLEHAPNMFPLPRRMAPAGSMGDDGRLPQVPVRSTEDTGWRDIVSDIAKLWAVVVFRTVGRVISQLQDSWPSGITKGVIDMQYCSGIRARSTSHPMKATRIIAGFCLVALGVARSAPSANMPFTLISPDLTPGKPIPERFTANAFGCHGPNESPALKWANAPVGTKSFAVTMFDPYKPPASGWWHWVVYDIPATAAELPRKAGDPGSPGMPAGAKQAPPDGEAPEPHYYGPCPDEGDPPHHYTITVYALSVDHLNVPSTSTPANIDYAISTKTLAKSTIVRLFSRPKKAP